MVEIYGHRMYGQIQYQMTQDRSMDSMPTKVFRVLVLLVALFGFLVYGYMMYGWTVEWHQNQSIHESLFTQLFFIVDTVIFISGLPPMLLVVYFLVLGKNTKDWAMGLLFVAISIPVHFYVAGVTAHTEPIQYIPIQLGELAIVIGLIIYWRKKKRQPINAIP